MRAAPTILAAVAALLTAGCATANPAGARRAADGCSAKWGCLVAPTATDKTICRAFLAHEHGRETVAAFGQLIVADEHTADPALLRDAAQWWMSKHMHNPWLLADTFGAVQVDCDTIGVPA